MVLRVGITGGMGSGKTTVAAIFETLGIPVYQADDAAKRLMNEDETLKTALVQAFGETVYYNGGLNKAYLAEAVFNNPEQLALLNALVHPATIADAEKWMLRQTTPYAIKEAAIIFETGSQQYLNYIIGVYAPTALRIQRSMARTGSSLEEVKVRMDQQMDDDMKMKRCDTVIINDEQQALIPQVIKLHEILLQLSGGQKCFSRP